MPIIWRYLLTQYLKVIFLSLLAFIGVLVVIRLEQIARFAAISGAWPYVLKFTALQIPYILPLALPISSLIATMILFLKLSSTHELTAFRSSGMGLRQILAPVLVAGCVLTMLNFYIVSEVATLSHLETRHLETKIRNVNPLIFLQSKKSRSLHGAFFTSLSQSQNVNYADDALIAFINSSQERINLLLAKRIETKDGMVKTEDMSIFATQAQGDPDLFDHLVLENVQHSVSPISEYTKLIKKEGWRLSLDHLQMPLLIVATRSAYSHLQMLKADPDANPLHITSARQRVQDCFSEFSRRVSLATAVLSFTLMGCAYGINISRNRSQKGLVTVVFLAATYLACFLWANDIDGSFYLRSSLYLAPHGLLSILSILTLKKISRGVE